MDKDIKKNKPSSIPVRSNVRSKTYMPGNKHIFIPKIRFKYVEEQNKEYNDYMEDIGFISQDFGGKKNKNLFCIFDGHGGVDSAKYCSENVHKILIRLLKDNPINIEYCLKNLFKKLDEKVKSQNCVEIGNTATIVFIEDNNLFCANVGDSKCVIVANNQVETLSYEDKCTDEDEQKRIASEGGMIIDERLCGVLAITRAIGDHDLKCKGLSAIPHFVKRSLSEKDKFCILGSDGIWDVITDENLLLLSKDVKDPEILANLLVKEAVKLGSTDNISCIVISFN